MPYEVAELKKFTDVGHAIAKSANISFEQWARGEMAVVMKAWASRTPVVSESNAVTRAYSESNKAAGTGRASRGGYKISINTGEKNPANRGFVWFKAYKGMQLAGTVNPGGNFTPRWLHFRDPDWREIKTGVEHFGSELAKRVPSALRAIGLARQSVIQIADVLGLSLESASGSYLSGGEIAKARAARAANGMTYQNGTGAEKKGEGYSIEAVNSYPLNQKLKMDAALASVLQTRIGTYENNIVKGVFKDLSAIERAYPYVKVAA